LKIISSTYASLRSLAKGTVSTRDLRGPAGIGGMAVELARKGSPVDFVYFIAFISAALAVFNFLPLPVVDGGHAVFLVIEKVRGRPLPIKVMNVIQIVGLVLLGGVFLLLTWQDIARMIAGLW
jgi:regulator of sigma E protease